MKKVLKWVGIGFAALLVVSVVGAWAMFGTFVKAARSIEKLEDGLYSMEFTGDYGFDAFLAGGGANSDSGVADYDAVVGSIKYGWITGYPDGTFGPENTVTRGEVTAIVNRMLGRSGDADYIRSHAEVLIHFDDLAQAHWAYYDIMEAVNGHDYENANGTECWKQA